jgi:hypothetical protein
MAEIQHQEFLMDERGFRNYLQERKISEEETEASIQLAERFEQFAQDGANPTKEEALAFSTQLIASGENTVANYYALARYAYFTQNNPVYIAVVDLLDGSEAMGNFHEKAKTVLGAERRDQIFNGVSVPELGLPNAEKVKITQTVMPRLVEEASPEECEKILSDSLRDLQDSSHADDKKLYEECATLDEFLDKSAQNFIALLEKLRDEGQPFFTQFITDEVVEYVREEPLIARGIREGNILYEAKIPHQTAEFLAESDPQKKRYHYCHCPWAKESLKAGISNIPATFCNCSAGFHKKRWEVIFDQKLKAEVIESVLQGDDWCKIAIHLPEDLA